MANEYYIEPAGPLQFFRWDERLKTSRSGKVTREVIRRDEADRILSYERFHQEPTPASSYQFVRAPNGDTLSIAVELESVLVNRVRFRAKRAASVAIITAVSAGRDVFERRTTFSNDGHILRVQIRRLYGDPEPRELRFEWGEGRLQRIEDWHLTGTPYRSSALVLHYGGDGGLRRIEEHWPDRLFQIQRFQTDDELRLVSEELIRDGEVIARSSYVHTASSTVAE